MHGIQLARLPLSAKIFCTLFLAGIGAGAAAACAQAVATVGVSFSAVRESFASDTPMTGLHHGDLSAEKEIDLAQIPATPRMPVRTPLLIQTSHTHLFGQTLIAGLLGLIFLFSSVREPLKAAIVSLPFAATFIDIGGMWATRFVSPSLSGLVTLGGTLFALGYLLIALLSLQDLWFGKETA